MEGPVEDMPVPFTAPPVLIDHKADVALAEMPLCRTRLHCTP